MDNTELYIDGLLCDTGNDFSIRLNRKIIDPSALNTKDAQYSYTITLPATPVNCRIFGYTNIEETKNKFIYDRAAELIVNSHRIFDGKFRLAEAGTDLFKGYLYRPVSKEAKDIFGEETMNRAAPFYLENFTDAATVITQINRNAATSPQNCIFPMALYGVIPKNGASDDRDRHVWDERSYWTIDDLPPSPNVLRMIKHFFESKGYGLQGTAMDDERLSSLYMSYHNPPGYLQPWNRGDLDSVSLSGNWANYTGTIESGFSYESKIKTEENGNGKFFSTDLLASDNLEIDDVNDPGNHLYYLPGNGCWISVPRSGYYKIILEAGMELADLFVENDEGQRCGYDDKDHGTGLSFTGGRQFSYYSGYEDNYDNTFDRKRYEIQVLRNFAADGFNNGAPAGYYNAPQFNQAPLGKDGTYPKYYPQAEGALVIDPGVNPNFICGLHWGATDIDFNPADTDMRCNYMFIANGESWDPEKELPGEIRSVYDSTDFTRSDNNYWRYDSLTSRSADKVRCGKVKNTVSGNYIQQSYDQKGNGYVECIIWLEEDEEITLNFVGDMGDLWLDGNKKSRSTHIVMGRVNFDLQVIPFRIDKEWGNFDSRGNYYGKAMLDWEDSSFPAGKIDLVRFLPSDITIDSFIENFCKAFNLQLTQTGERIFSLDPKEVKGRMSHEYIDLDPLAGTQIRINTPLELPSNFSVVFTIDPEEEGYIVSQNNGGGNLFTGIEGNGTIEQQSDFSFNWFKEVPFAGQNVVYSLPILSKHGIWEWDERKDDYTMVQGEAEKKKYTEQALRFWYYKGIFDFAIPLNRSEKLKVLPALVSNTLPGKMELCYENRPNTILSTFFTVMADAGAHYTEVECYLTAEMYKQIDGTRYVKYNGDRYHVGEVSGFDPSEKNKTRLKLIKKT